MFHYIIIYAKTVVGITNRQFYFICLHRLFKMQMFDTFLSSIPKNRSEMVTDLEIPDLTLSPYIWEPADYLTRSDSLLTTSTEEELRTLDTDSSIPLSRAMTDSEIDYQRFRRVSSCNQKISQTTCMTKDK